MHSCDCSSTWHSPPECLLWALRKKKIYPHNSVSTEHHAPGLQEGILVVPCHDLHQYIVGTEQVQHFIRSPSLSRGQRLWCHPTSFVETLINASPSFHRSSFLYCAGTNCFRKLWQKRAEKVALLNPVYLTVSITTWHSYLYSRRI